jgi:plastocyanin
MERTGSAGVGMGERKELAMKILAGVIVAGVVGVVLTATHVGAASPAAVGIQEFKFTPPALAIPVGTTVTWVNHDEETHTITSATGAFGSTGLSHDDTFAQTFTRPGRYEYFCALHPHMKAIVIVK